MQLHHIWLCIGEEWGRMQFRACKASEEAQRAISCMSENMHCVCFSYPEKFSGKLWGRESHTYVRGACPSAVTRLQMCAVKVPGDVLSTAAFLPSSSTELWGLLGELSWDVFFQPGLFGRCSWWSLSARSAAALWKQKDSETKERWPKGQRNTKPKGKWSFPLLEG